MAVNCLADEIVETYEYDAEEFEQILRDVASQGKNLEAPHYAFALSRLGYDQSKAREEFRRVTRAVTLQSIAGTPEQQTAAEVEAQTAAEVFAKEGPKLEAKIQELQTKLNGLERDKRLTEKRVADQREAMAKLPEVAPAFLRKKIGKAESLLNTQGIGKELQDAKQRQQELRCILNLGNVYESQDRHIEYGLRRLCPDAVISTAHNRMMTYGYSPAWPGIKAAAETEYAEVTARIPELQAAYDVALAEVKKPLTDYFFTNSDD